MSSLIIVLVVLVLIYGVILYKKKKLKNDTPTNGRGGSEFIRDPINEHQQER